MKVNKNKNKSVGLLEFLRMREEMPPGCGACCALYTGTVGGVPMFGAFQSALLVISMLALHVKLQLACHRLSNRWA